MSDAPNDPAKGLTPFASPRAWSLMVPIAFAGMMLVGGVGWVATVFSTSGTADGPTVDVRFDSACAADTISARLGDYGLPGVWTGASLRLTLPGGPGDDDLPAALAAVGQLSMTGDGTHLVRLLTNAGVQISIQGVSVSLFTFDAALPEHGLVVTLDGVEMEVESVNGNELMLASRAGHSTDALRVATDRVVQVRHPLPCTVRVQSVTPVGD
ncbi:MAG: hypothetical protein EXR71_00115 [Myxococcales bacterium]|nr:hypothetical protein [Myxococcales bacterium]